MKGRRLWCEKRAAGLKNKNLQEILIGRSILEVKSGQEKIAEIWKEMEMKYFIKKTVKQRASFIFFTSEFELEYNQLSKLKTQVKKVAVECSSCRECPAQKKCSQS